MTESRKEKVSFYPQSRSCRSCATILVLGCKAPSDTQGKYYYNSLENLNMDPDEEMYEEEDDSLPDLPIEVRSHIIVQLSFSDKVGVRVQ